MMKVEVPCFLLLNSIDCKGGRNHSNVFNTTLQIIYILILVQFPELRIEESAIADFRGQGVPNAKIRASILKLPACTILFKRLNLLLKCIQNFDALAGVFLKKGSLDSQTM